MSLWLTDEEQDHIDDVTALMEDSNTGHGYKTTSTSKADGTPGQGRVSLSCEDAANMDYAKAQIGVSSFGKWWYRKKGLVTHQKQYDSNRTLTRAEMNALSDSDRLNIKARVLANLGFTLADMNQLDKTPDVTDERDTLLRLRFDRAVYEVWESGGTINDLARALGLSIKPARSRNTTSGCPRLQGCIRRHKDRLAHPENYEPVTCAASRCDKVFRKRDSRQTYCSSPCQQAERNKRLAAKKRQKREAAAAAAA